MVAALKLFASGKPRTLPLTRAGGRVAGQSHTGFEDRRGPRRALYYRPDETTTFWQKRYYDHNVRSHESFEAKLRYIHRNPVRRGLVAKPEGWKWSSFRHYALAEVGPVEIESRWTADRRIGRVPNLVGMIKVRGAHIC